MPKIVIREKDYTTPGLSEYENFSVVVPGFVNSEKCEDIDQRPGGKESVFDENGVYELNTIKDFEEHIGFVPAVQTTINDSSIIPAHYGNQIAYELIKLGYTVLYVFLGSAEVIKAEGGKKIIKPDAKLWEDYYKLVSTTNNIFAPLVDKANYDFRFIVTGLLTANEQANKNAIAVAAFSPETALFEDVDATNGRGDAIALVDIDESVYTDLTDKTSSKIIAAIAEEGNKYTSKYAACFAPTLCYSNIEQRADYNDNIKFPASFHYLACLRRSLNNSFKEWYAVAGLNRGVSPFNVASTEVRLGEPAINKLEPRTKNSLATTAVNLIVKIRDEYYLWGNRTAEALQESNGGGLIASHFLNIRQLCTTLKKEIYLACRRFTFDPNSDVLWVNFCNALRPTLEEMKADQGIRDYQIIKVATTQKAMLKARVRIVPIEAVEDFDIELSLEDSLGTTSVSISE